MSKKKKKDRKLRRIYTPRPGYDDEDEDIHSEPMAITNIPSWHRHFEEDELFGRYEPNRELGTFLHHRCLYTLLYFACY